MANFVTPPPISTLKPPTDLKTLAAQTAAVNHALQAIATQLSKRLIKPKNIANSAIQLRHLDSALYALATDIAAIRMGLAGVTGTKTTVARADHTHLVQPVLYLQRADVASFSANTNNLALADVNHTQQYITASGAVNLTGIAGGADGYCVLFTNKGTQTITLTHEDAGSTAANRFHLSTGAGIALAQDQSIMLVYDATLGRWRNVTRP